MTIVECVLLSLAAFSAVTLWIAYASVASRLLFRTAAATREGEPVSILKPLKGVDEGLLENLRAIAQQDHQDFEIIFGCEDPNDPALEVARAVAREFPQRRIVVASGAAEDGLNPKVRLLRRLIESARHEWILISDSNVRPPADYLRGMQQRQQQTGAHLVHSMLCGVGGKSLGGRLEELQLNGWVAASVCMIDLFGRPCVIGKSMLMTQTALGEVGGLVAVKDILAEDYVLGTRLIDSGHRVALSPQPLPVVTGRSGVQHFFNRHVRWGQMRRRISPFFFCAELMANPTPFLLLLLVSSDGSLRALAGCLVLLKWLVDAVVYRLLSPQPRLRTLLLMPFKDAMVLTMWLVSALRTTVIWRGHRMLVGPGSRLLPLPENARGRSSRLSWLRRVLLRV